MYNMYSVDVLRLYLFYNAILQYSHLDIFEDIVHNKFFQPNVTYCPTTMLCYPGCLVQRNVYSVDYCYE